MKNNLLVVSLSNTYTRQVGEALASFLEIFYVDLNDILEYNLVNSNMLESAGKQYFDMERQRVIKSVTEYNNSLVVANLELLLANGNLSCFKDNFFIVYLYCDKSQLESFEAKQQNRRNLYAFDEEDKIIKRVADIVIEADINSKNQVEMIKNGIVKYLEASDENR